MTIKQVPFTRYELDESKRQDTFTIKLNPQERLEFNRWKYALQQEKDSTAMKQLAKLGANVLLDDKMKGILEVVLGNYRKNKRLGIVTFD